MAKLLFRPAELLNELSSLQGLAAGLVDRSSPYNLKELSDDIVGLQARGGLHTLEIPRDRPLRTRTSVGEFEPPHKHSGRRVYGVITGIWDIEAAKVPILDPSRPNRKSTPTMLIRFVGKASTVFEVIDEDSDSVIACWKMELGDGKSPGCFFHTFASSDHTFPVPRHPNIFATPMSAIGFVLGELFHGDWEKAVSGTSDAPNRWRSIQTKRFKALMGWQLEEVSKTTSSPWCTLKIAKPNDFLFL